MVAVVAVAALEIGRWPYARTAVQVGLTLTLPNRRRGGVARRALGAALEEPSFSARQDGGLNRRGTTPL